MRNYLLVIVALLIGACASHEKDDQISDAIDDFIVVSELEEVPMIRSYHQFDQKVLNEWYVIVHTKKDYYLLAYSQRCYIIYDTPRRPDRRMDPHAIYADTDTFRGCHIKSLYTLTEAQAAELMQIGRAPGEG
jgi:hypothetical protein